MREEAYRNLSAKLLGSVITPGSDEYEVAWRVYNRMIDRRPDAIVRCADVADIMTSVNFARNEDVAVAIRGGGHNGAGLGVCDNGLLTGSGQPGSAIGVGWWFVVLGMGLVMFIAGKPRLPGALLVLAGTLFSASHVTPTGPLAMACFIGAAVDIELAVRNGRCR